MAYNPLNPNGQASMAGSQPVVIASNQSPVSVLATITGNPSVSGTVNVGNFPVTSGSVVAFQGTNPFIITGSVQATLTPAANQSVSGTVGASVIGLTPVSVSNFPANQNVSGSVLSFITSTNASIITVAQSSIAVAIVSGSIAASFTPPANQSVSGTVTANQGTSPWIITGSVQGSFSASGNQSVSGTVGASIIGLTPVSISNFPTNQNVSGSVLSFIASTNASVITVGQSSIAAVIVGGSIAASFTPPANQSVSGMVTVGSILSIPGVISTANSTTATLTANSVFTGTSEDVKDFAGIVISVFADQASAVDGLSVQQSSNGTNWDITDVYTIPASTGKTFSFQPAARFLRVVYTNGGTNQGAFRLQTVYHITATKPSSQRAQDAYTNETDLEQVWGFNSYWNGTTWDRIRGTVTAGMLVNPGSSSILSLQTGTAITSIVGSYSEDAGHTSGDVGLFTMGVRNEAMSSITSTDLDYSPHAVGPVGETLVANAPLTKWVNAATSIFTGGSVATVAAQGASVFTYITSYQVVNDSANYSRLTFFGGTSSVIGYGVAPASSGSNVLLPNAMKTNANGAFSASISGVASVYLSVQGFTSKT